MSHSTYYKSRTGEVPCGDRDLYAFLTDMRNFKNILPDNLVSEWVSSEDKCSFNVGKAGSVTASLLEALPHSLVSYTAENLFTGNLVLQIAIEHITSLRSGLYITADVNMNPLARMILGDAVPQYLDRLIDFIENYKGYDNIRGYSQSL